MANKDKRSYVYQARRENTKNNNFYRLVIRKQ